MRSTRRDASKSCGGHIQVVHGHASHGAGKGWLAQCCAYLVQSRLESHKCHLGAGPERPRRERRRTHEHVLGHSLRVISDQREVVHRVHVLHRARHGDAAADGDRDVAERRGDRVPIDSHQASPRVNDEAAAAVAHARLAINTERAEKVDAHERVADGAHGLVARTLTR
eukprot:scaffold17516_cov134-Isochrysis_galbana.AAC.3